MGLRDEVRQRVIGPAFLRLHQWRGDPVARMLAPEVKHDPYPLWSDVRRRGVYRSPLGAWATADHDTVGAVLRDRRFSASPVHHAAYRPPAYPPGDPRGELATSDLLTMDPPDHTRIRRLVSRAFSPKVIAGLEPWIRDRIEELLAPLDPSAGFDLVDALAFPLPIAVICRLLGVPADDEDRFRAWGHDLAALLEPQATLSAEARTRATELALTAYLRDLVQARRRDPG